MSSNSTGRTFPPHRKTDCDSQLVSQGFTSRGTNCLVILSEAKNPSSI
jgi:hypothetical protein